MRYVSFIMNINDCRKLSWFVLGVWRHSNLVLACILIEGCMHDRFIFEWMINVLCCRAFVFVHMMSTMNNDVQILLVRVMEGLLLFCVGCLFLWWELRDYCWLPTFHIYWLACNCNCCIFQFLFGIYYSNIFWNSI